MPTARPRVCRHAAPQHGGVATFSEANLAGVSITNCTTTAGTYMVHRSLQIKGSNTTTPYYHAAVSGDGKASTIIRAAKNGEWTQATNSSNLAVVFFPSCCGALPKSGGGFYLRDLNIQANSAADYGVLAPAVQASLFQRIYVK